MRRSSQTLVATLGATALLVVGIDLATYAGTGDTLVIGQLNRSNSATVVSNDAGGPALRLKTAARTDAPLSVNGIGKVTHLNADQVDGKGARELGTHAITYVAGKRLQTVPGQAVWRMPVKPGLYEVSFRAMLMAEIPQDQIGVNLICGVADANQLNENPRIYTAASASYFGDIPAALSGASTVRIKPGAAVAATCVERERPLPDLQADGGVLHPDQLARRAESGRGADRRNRTRSGPGARRPLTWTGGRIRRNARCRTGHLRAIVDGMATIALPPGLQSGQSLSVPRLTSAFVGRTDELALLDAAVRRAHDGEHALAVVSGESGIGKSRLLDEFAAAASKADTLVLRSWCAPVAGAGVAFGPVATLLREVLRLVPDTSDVVRELVPDAAYLVPEQLHRAPEGNSLSGELAQLRLLEAFRSILAETARSRPVVAIVEDVQWADRSSADALAYLTTRSQPAGLMVVVSYRSEDLRRHHFMHPIVAEMERAPHSQRIRLEPFEALQVREQTTRLIGAEPTEDLVRELAERSGGNPFFVEELVSAAWKGTTLELPESVPSSLSDVLTARFDPLSGEHRHLIRFAAAVGGEIHPDLLSASTGVDPRFDRRCVAGGTGRRRPGGDRRQAGVPARAAA